MSYLVAVIVILVLALLAVSIWVNGAKPKKAILDKYSRQIISQATFPLCRGWELRIDKEDIDALKKYRKRFSILYTASFVVFLLFMLIILSVAPMHGL